MPEANVSAAYSPSAAIATSVTGREPFEGVARLQDPHEQDLGEHERRHRRRAREVSARVEAEEDDQSARQQHQPHEPKLAQRCHSHLVLDPRLDSYRNAIDHRRMVAAG